MNEFEKCIDEWAAEIAEGKRPILRGNIYRAMLEREKADEIAQAIRRAKG